MVTAGEVANIYPPPSIKVPGQNLLLLPPKTHPHRKYSLRIYPIAIYLPPPFSADWSPIIFIVLY
jgi:hypothetical protein